jgi:hypothetical protein
LPSLQPWQPSFLWGCAGILSAHFCADIARRGHLPLRAGCAQAVNLNPTETPMSKIKKNCKASVSVAASAKFARTEHFRFMPLCFAISGFWLYSCLSWMMEYGYE